MAIVIQRGKVSVAVMMGSCEPVAESWVDGEYDYCGAMVALDSPIGGRTHRVGRVGLDDAEAALVRAALAAVAVEHAGELAAIRARDAAEDAKAERIGRAEADQARRDAAWESEDEQGAMS